MAWLGFQMQTQWDLVNLYVKEAQNASEANGKAPLVRDYEQTSSASPDVLWYNTTLM